MTKNYKTKKSINNSNWWQPGTVERIMLWLTAATVLISILAQASSIVNNILQFDSIYMQLYPLLNIFHIYVLFYIIFNLKNIKQFIPSLRICSSKDDEYKYKAFREKIKEWIINHFGSIYLEEWEKNDDDFNNYVDKLTDNTNKNITKTHTYFLIVFGCFVLLYVFELVNSFTYTVNEPVLHILTMIFNNIATLFWFYIYLTFNVTKTTIEITKDEKIKKGGKTIKESGENFPKGYGLSYCLSKAFYWVWRTISLASIFGRPHKFKLYEREDTEYCKRYEKYLDKYETIEISKNKNWKFWSFLFLLATIAGFIWFICYFRNNHILEIEKIKDQSEYSWFYYSFRALSMFSILLGGCAMLATFSRLSSGYKKVPLAAFLIMVFYAALQPLFFAGSELSASNMQIGQLLFIANALCLLGKFGLLHLIKWFFGNHHIAYYFIAEQIIKDKTDELNNRKYPYNLDKLFCYEEI